MNQREDVVVLEAMVHAAQSGRRCALATVLETRGSTPRKSGTRMLVDPERGLVGTVGGGCGEAEVIEAAHQVLAGEPPRVVEVDLTRDLMSWSPAVCGGVMRVFVEAVEPMAPDRAPAAPNGGSAR